MLFRSVDNRTFVYFGTPGGCGTRFPRPRGRNNQRAPAYVQATGQKPRLIAPNNTRFLPAFWPHGTRGKGFAARRGQKPPRCRDAAPHGPHLWPELAAAPWLRIPCTMALLPAAAAVWQPSHSAGPCTGNATQPTPCAVALACAPDTTPLQSAAYSRDACTCVVALAYPTP